MQLRSTFTAVLLVLAEVTAAKDDCAELLVRKEWRKLSRGQQLEYISAVKCLQSEPGRTQDLFSGVQSRYDDYLALHINMTDQIHFNAPFLPWHRRFLAIWEADLRSTCGYTGAQPYWDWSLDTVSEDSWVQSPLFDDVYGFGGNGEYIEDISNLTITATIDVPGRTGGGCVTTGPFANLSVSMGPDYSLSYTPHCLRRDFSPYLANMTLNQSFVDWIDTADIFTEYDHRVQILNLETSGITTHGGGHFAVGGEVGEMSNMYSSPGDPLFFLHHSKLDFEWNKWQRLNWPNRSTDIGGPDTMWAYPYNFFGDVPYKNITLAYDLIFGEMASTVSVSEVMDTTSGVLCYTYE